MLHGTSVESAVRLFEEHVLPPGHPDFVKNRGKLWYNDTTKDRLYFSPIRSQLRGTNVYSRLLSTRTRENAIDDARFYARSNTVEQYMRNLAGLHKRLAQRHEDWMTALGKYSSIEIGKSWTPQNIEMLVKDFGLSYTVNEAIGILNTALKRKGVIVEANRGILGLKHGTVLRKGDDLVWVYVPKGLPIDYIDAVHPLSRVDARIIEKYFK